MKKMKQIGFVLQSTLFFFLASNVNANLAGIKELQRNIENGRNVTSRTKGNRLIDAMKKIYGEEKFFQLLEKEKERAEILQHQKSGALKSFGQESSHKFFTCEPIPPSVKTPTSVHKLRPGDIKVVAALGDSLTAGNGILALTAVGVLWEFRGWSWSAGGETSPGFVAILPNFLKFYNPKLKGFSMGKEFMYSSPNKDAHLNVAAPNNHATEMPDQAEDLIRRIKNSREIDFEKDWKMISIFVGQNDVCDFFESDGREKYSAMNFERNMNRTLDLLFSIPRAIVNLVEPIDVTLVRFLNDGFICSTLHHEECWLAHHPESVEEGKALRKAYISALHRIASSSRFARPDFAVVVQPMFRDQSLWLNSDGNVDFSYFAPDCFHWSLKGHEAAAGCLWSNIFQPVNSKSTDCSLSPFVCPTKEDPYIKTAINSKGGRM